jgi:hypothetical protein
MHPALQHALVNEHRAELLRHQQVRCRGRDPSLSDAAVIQSSARGLRRALGIALVMTGARLLGDNRSGVDLLDVLSDCPKYPRWSMTE